MAEYEFVTTVTTAQAYGPHLKVDSCSDGTVWLRGEGNGIHFHCNFTVLQARALANGLIAAITDAESALEGV